MRAELRLATVPKSLVRCWSLVLIVALVATACINDAQPSSAPPANLTDTDPESRSAESTSTTVAPETSVAPTSTTTTVVDLAFQDPDEVAVQQLWTDVDSVSFEQTLQFDLDPDIEISGTFTAGQGLVIRVPDPVEGDILAVIRDGETFQAYRVGNEVFLDGPLEAEPALSSTWRFLVDLVAPLLSPLETGVLPTGASVFVNDSTTPDVLYSLVPGESEGTINILGQSPIRVTADAPDGGYPVPETGVNLTREQVGNSGNPVLMDWYLDQAG